MTRTASIVLAFALVLGFVPVALAQRAGPPDSFDIDVLTAYRYGLNHDWAPASCFGRRYCPEAQVRRSKHAELGAGASTGSLR